MTPTEFRSKLAARRFPPLVLFLGPDAWERERCRRELIDAVLGPEERESGLSRHDLDSSTLAEVLDDARAMSLFAPVRVIHALGAESALPRGRAGKDEETPAFQSLSEYLARPTEGATVLLESGRYEFDNDDKTKVDRIRKFYAAVPWVVEFPRFSDAAAQSLVRELAAARGLRIPQPQAEALVEVLNADASRIAGEIEKLALYLGPGGQVEDEHIDALVADAKATTIFRLVAAIGAGNRMEALSFLDTLIRQNEYLPLALTFLSTQFRMALAARELNLRTAQQIQSHCQRIGMAMWRSRADQIVDTATRFSAARLRRALRLIAYADRALRDARPDDRVVMENFVLRLTA
ncbi:MAG: DNA polymerase III subunit delta [Bryobacterales bacterium]|nr:DNA polymerase III subunit delta [Bryobacterales bacterium]